MPEFKLSDRDWLLLGAGAVGGWILRGFIQSILATAQAPTQTQLISKQRTLAGGVNEIKRKIMESQRPIWPYQPYGTQQVMDSVFEPARPEGTFG